MGSRRRTQPKWEGCVVRAEILGMRGDVIVKVIPRVSVRSSHPRSFYQPPFLTLLNERFRSQDQGIAMYVWTAYWKSVIYFVLARSMCGSTRALKICPSLWYSLMLPAAGNSGIEGSSYKYVSAQIPSPFCTPLFIFHSPAMAFIRRYFAPINLQE